MAYGLPARGQHDYDDELNNSIEYTRGQAEAAVADASAARSTAIEARSLAQSVKEFVEGPTDEQIAAKVAEASSASQGAVDARVDTKVDPIRDLSDATFAANLSASYVGVRKLGTAITANGPLGVGKYNRVDATAGALTVTLPTGAAEGATLLVEKSDTGPYTVSITGNIRGVAGSALFLHLPHEGRTFTADATGSWYPESELRVLIKDGTDGSVLANMPNGPASTTVAANVLIGNRTGRTVDPATSIHNVAIGPRALEIGAAASSNNVALGFQAMGTTIGIGNVALGYSTLGGAEAANGPVGFVPPANQNYNVAIGYEAIIYGTDATDNVIVGHNAMTEIYSGQGNVALGARSLRAVKDVAKFNIAIGYSALDNGTVVGTGTRGHNVAIGKDAMLNATGADVTDNIAVGASAGAALQGRNNIFIGREAGVSQTTAIENVAVGTFALRSNQTGTGIVAIGTDAARNTTVGPVTAIGWAALKANVSGTANVAIGKQALTNSTTSNNTAIGSAALQNQTGVGANNTAIGASALTALTTATNNTAIGYLAGVATTTGGENTFIGRSAGAANTTGATNTYIGYSAGGLAATVNAVAIGRGAAVSANEATAIGQGSSAAHANSVALGRSSTTTAADQVQMGARHISLTEVTAPGVAATNAGWIFLNDSGSGKTQLCVQFQSGTPIVIATEA